MQRHADYAAFVASAQPQRLFALTTKGAPAHSAVSYQDGDFFDVWPETRGLPASILDAPAAGAENPYSDDAGQPQYEPVKRGVGGGV